MILLRSMFRLGCRLYARHAVPLTVFAVSRLGLFLVAYLSLILIPINASSGIWRNYPQNLFLDGWARWDSGWYVDIASGGYSLVPNALGQTNIPFFPFYPLLIWLAGPLFGDTFLAGLTLSNVAFLCALGLLIRLVNQHHPPEVGRRSLILLAVYPFSFFFSAVYTESLFLLAVVAAFYFGERQRWVWAGAAAAVAGATRVVGFLTVPGLIILYLEQQNFDWRRLRSDILWPLIGFAGPGSYVVYLATRFGEPLLFYKSQLSPAWSGDINVIRPILATLLALLSPQVLAAGTYPLMDVIHIGMLLLALGLCLAAWWRLPRAYAIWSLLMIVASTPVWRSSGRLVMVIFPLFIVGAVLLDRQRVYHVVLYFSTLLLGLFTVAFAHFYWAG